MTTPPPSAERGHRTRDDLPEWVEDPGAQHPGIFPFLRGIHPHMYTGRLWRMRQYAGFGNPRATNERWKALLARGQDGISCAFDLPTQLGYDPDDPRASADVGRLGVSIATLDDLVEVFDGIPLDETAVTFNINASAAVLYAMLLEAAEAQEADLESLRGTLSNDPLMEYISRGLWRVDTPGAMRLSADTFAYSLEHTPNFYPMNLRGTLVYEAGGSLLHEVAYSFSCAVAYLDQLRSRGVDMAAAARRFSFLFFSDSNLLEQAAKFRAARMLWANIIRDRYEVTEPSAQHLRFTAAVGNFNLRAQLPELNIVRNTLGALGAALGGCQAMLVAGMDEAFEIPSEYSSLLGLYTQQVVALESDVARTVDPLGGGYLTEASTDDLVTSFRELLDDLDEQGGALAAISSGQMQRQIADAAFEAQLEEESGKRPVVGVNTPGSPPPSDPDFELHVHDERAAKERREALMAVRERRDVRTIEAALAELDRVLHGTDNVIPAIRRSVRAGASIGEVMDRVVSVYGEFTEPVEV